MCVLLDFRCNPGRLLLMKQARYLFILVLVPVVARPALTAWRREVVDWSVIAGAGAGGFILKDQEPFFERPLMGSRWDKPFIEEQVPNSWLYAASAAMIGLSTLLPNQEGWVNARSYRHLKGSLQAVSTCLLIKEFSKDLVGRRRPDYHDRLERGIKVEKARKSWPSGHATHAFNVATYLGLFTWDEWRSDESWATGVKSGITALLAGGAAWVAYTRVADNRHYPGDVVAGSLLGAGCAVLTYSWQHWWGNPDTTEVNDINGSPAIPSFSITLVRARF